MMVGALMGVSVLFLPGVFARGTVVDELFYFGTLNRNFTFLASLI